jgi:hypothetical protein
MVGQLEKASERIRFGGNKSFDTFKLLGVLRVCLAMFMTGLLIKFCQLTRTLLCVFGCVEKFGSNEIQTKTQQRLRKPKLLTVLTFSFA